VVKNAVPIQLGERSTDICGEQFAFTGALVDGNTVDAWATGQRDFGAPCQVAIASHYSSHPAAVVFT